MECHKVFFFVAPKCQNLILFAQSWLLPSDRKGIVGTSLQWLSTMCAEECSLLDCLFQGVFQVKVDRWSDQKCHESRGLIFGFSFLLSACSSSLRLVVAFTPSKLTQVRLSEDEQWPMFLVTMSQYGPQKNQEIKVVMFVGCTSTCHSISHITSHIHPISPSQVCRVRLRSRAAPSVAAHATGTLERSFSQGAYYDGS